MNRLPLLAALLIACPPDSGPPDEANLGGADGIAITEVAAYQGVKRTLSVDGEAVDSDVPLIEGRDALIRVFYSDDDYGGSEVIGRLHIGDETIEVTGVLDGPSEDDDLGSTVNFDVPGDLVRHPLEWSVELLAEDEDNSAAVQAPLTTDIEGERNVLRVIIAPFSYEFDGSGRLPDLSDGQIQRFRDTLFALYPVSDVDIQVRDPQPWANRISPDGSDWFGLGFALLGYRDADGADDATYYYGMFNPAETLPAYCGIQGCLLGVTLLNNDPPSTGSVTLRLALGVGFTEGAPLVAAHELGHSHGRNHAPCAPGNQIDGVDPGFPTNDGTIGVWGYDLTSGELKDPDDATDLMGYCDDQHVSAYTYTALHNRGQNVNADALGPARTYDVLHVTESGVEFATTTQRSLPVSGEGVDVTLLSAGAPTTVRGSYLAWDHLPGGVLVVPRPELVPDRAEFTLDGTFRVATR